MKRIQSCHWAPALLSVCVLLAMTPARSQSSSPLPLPPPGSPPEHGPQRPALFYREQWKQSPGDGEHPVASESVANPNLELTLIVPAGQIMMAGVPGDENNPLHTWSGLCTSPCGLALRDRLHWADLTGLARIRWTTRTSGFHRISPVLKLADGNWYVGDRADGSPRDWFVSEFALADLHWLRLDVARAVTTGAQLDHVDLAKVDAIGFIDLMPSSGHGPGGWSDVAQIEVYGTAVPR